LRDQDAIERIAMMSRKISHRVGVLERDGERQEAVAA
jgi:hypothetical protein